MILDLQWFHFKKWKIPTIRKNVRFPLLAKEHLMILDLLSLMILGLMILVKKTLRCLFFRLLNLFLLKSVTHHWEMLFLINNPFLRRGLD